MKIDSKIDAQTLRLDAMQEDQGKQGQRISVEETWISDAEDSLNPVDTIKKQMLEELDRVKQKNVELEARSTHSRSTSDNLQTLFPVLHQLNPEIRVAALFVNATKEFYYIEWPVYATSPIQDGAGQGDN
ncbi:hypothetical protein NDU88_005044 [Pleurodeles waltl]|uniref:Uncharacterized protein n=1 Tax=Pleurodeles waltl TaxID=8319 RepID=A0AAV7VHY0_PLEWA|nr:hypothetical protein NDU88_005044 [Pleurodeles waltl]